MLMSKSRLEKFLYALYSLDSSDLPNPLSRIEELYKCLVTGEEAPTFEPLSRVEKYLMAILGVYDVELLPNPLSRVEVLLHKLATGDDNLDDVKSFLSEHEELLAEIIRNGGVGGNIDIEYVLYTLSTEFNTLYNTAEKPVKSAILKGNTLVNMVENQHFALDSGDAYKRLYTLNVPVKLNTTYTVYISLNCADKITTTKEGVFRIKKDSNDGKDLIDPIQFDTSDTTSSTELKVTIQNVDCKYFHFRSYNFKIENVILMLLEGDHSSEDIPYFEGMQSVKMPVLTTTGKQLLNVNDLSNIITTDGTIPTLPTIINAEEGIIQINDKSRENNKGYKVKVKPNTDYVGSCLSSGSHVRCRILDLQGNKLNEERDYNSTIYYSFNSGDNDYVVVAFTCHTTKNEQVQIALYEGTTQPTSYESHKSNILTVNEEVELCGIGDVKDELNLLTGDVISRTGSYTYKGEIIPYFNQSIGGYVASIGANANVTLKSGIISDRFALGSFTDHDTGVYGNSNGYFYFFDKLTSSSQEFIEKYIGANFRFELLEDSIKTVDLSVVNQDGNNTNLSTFDDITHVTLSSEGLIPEAELEVATKNEEVLNTMSLEMDDISTTQNDLQETSNTQSENVDATMIATTEIYEQLL